MVSYYNNMYRQQAMASNPPVHSWYGYPAPQEQQMWEPQWHPAAAHHNHGVPHVFNDFGDFQQQQEAAAAVLASPTVTEMSSGAPSPQQRPPPARSPYEWIKKTSYQSQPNPGKTRTKDKYRVVYTDHQRVELEKEFYYSRYITIRRKAELANNLGLSERQVKIWFQNRRAKERKQVKKREEFTQKEPPTTTIPMSHHLSQQQLMHAASNQTQLPQNIIGGQIM